MAGPHAPDVRAVDLRLLLLGRGEDAELRGEGGVGDRTQLRAVLAREARVAPAAVRGVERGPHAAADRLKQDLPRAGERHVHGNRVLAELALAGAPHDLAVRPHAELGRGLAVALAGARFLGVVVDAHHGLERGHLPVRGERDAALGVRADAARVDLAGQGDGMAVDGLPRGDLLPRAARRGGEVELIHVFDAARAQQRAERGNEKDGSLHVQSSSKLFEGHYTISPRFGQTQSHLTMMQAPAGMAVTTMLSTSTRPRS